MDINALRPLTADHDPEDCGDCHSRQMHIFSDGTDSYVATCVYEIPVLYERMYGASYPSDEYHNGGESLADVWIKQSDEEPLKIHYIDGVLSDAGPSEVKTHAEWAQECGIGFLCSREW